MTPEQKQQHEFAEKIRRMTDAEISEFFNEIYENAECVKSIEIGKGFVCDFVNGIHPSDGFRKSTIAKLKAYAIEMDYMQLESEEAERKEYG